MAETHTLLLGISILLILAKGLGELMEKLGQPALLGEILAGIIMGPQLLGPHLFAVPVHQVEVMNFCFELGAIFLLFSAGYGEVRLDRLFQARRNALIVTFTEVPLAFLFGFVVGYIFDYSLMGMLFIGLAFSLTSIGVTVRTLIDLDRLQKDYGMNILGTAVLDDIIGLLILAVLVFMKSNQGDFSLVAMAPIGLKVLLFFATLYFFYRYGLRAMERIAERLNVPEGRLTVALCFVFLCSYLAWLAQLDFILGAFGAGLILGQSSSFKTRDMEYKLHGIANGMFVPIFFAVLGTMVDFEVFKAGGLFALVIVLTAITGKLVGGFTGGCLAGYRWEKALVIGVGIIPRTGVELAVATIALKAGIIDQRMFTAAVTMVASTVIITPILLKAAIAFLERREGPDEDVILSKPCT